MRTFSKNRKMFTANCGTETEFCDGLSYVDDVPVLISFEFLLHLEFSMWIMFFL